MQVQAAGAMQVQAAGATQVQAASASEPTAAVVASTETREADTRGGSARCETGGEPSTAGLGDSCDAGGSSDAGLSTEAALELVAKAESAKRGGNATMTVHGWSISYVLRPPCSCSRGDIYLVCPSDGDVVRSIIGLRRKLGLAPPPPAPALPPRVPMAAARAAEGGEHDASGDAVPAPDGAAAMRSAPPATRRQRTLSRPKAAMAHAARQQLESAAADAARAHDAVALSRRHVEAAKAVEEAALALVEAAMAKHAKAEAAVSKAYADAQEAARALEATRMHVCVVAGCGERFHDAAALRAHAVRAHRTRHTASTQASPAKRWLKCLGAIDRSASHNTVTSEKPAASDKKRSDRGEGGGGASEKRVRQRTVEREGVLGTRRASLGASAEGSS